MKQFLMLIESPNKIKTIGKYLKSDSIKIMATNGHIRELNERTYKGLGFDENTFEVAWKNDSIKTYKGKKVDIINEINREAKKCDGIYLSTDPDREGEAISWHIYSVLDDEYKDKCKRVVFNEITKDAITKALNNSRDLDQNQINSYLARKILDRGLGFKLSAFVRSGVGGLSAGRVQSIALKFLKDRDLEIKSFVPEHWFNLTIDLKNNLTIDLKKAANESSFKIHPNLKNGLVNFLEESEIIEFKKTLSNECILSNISEVRVEKQNPVKALKTSTMHSKAINLFHMSSALVDSIAQKLYEGVEINGDHVSLITYPRTDREDLSSTFVSEAKEFVISQYGNQYWNGQRAYKQPEDSIVQGAHEAIRPTYIDIVPDSIKDQIGEKEWSLYKLIWSYSIASLMQNAVYENVVYSFDNNSNLFCVNCRNEVFDGFKKLLRHQDLLEEFKQTFFPQDLVIGNVYEIKDINIKRVDKEPPRLYTESSLIKALEIKGIGRPSTYSHIVNIVLKREYAEKQSGKLSITNLGLRMADLLEQYFPTIMQYDYTKHMEMELDNISKNKSDWKFFLKEVFKTFSEELEKANESYLGKCEECGASLISKFSRKNRKYFVGCSRYPDCSFIKRNAVEDQSLNSLELLNESCPECSQTLVKRKNKWGRFFISCSGYPNCKYVSSLEEKELLNESCPECSQTLVKLIGKWNKPYIRCNSKECKYTRRWKEDLT